jgi:hypothetical protein|tara:strand:- start:435 stop:608 length:174 start_codon:yes stop_codon:yes gene_type:complete
MLTKLFINSLATFLHLTLKEKSVTKIKLKKLLNIFTKMWISEMRKNKTNAREIKKKQ